MTFFCLKLGIFIISNVKKKKTLTSISLIILHVSNIIEKSYVRNCQKVNVPFLKNKTEIFAPTKNIWYTVPCIYKNKKNSLFKKKKTKPVFLVKWYFLQFIELIELMILIENGNK